MKKGFHIGECYFCHQGYVYFSEAVQTKQVFLKCEECDSEWGSPEGFKKNELADCSHDAKYRPLTLEEMLKHPWRTYVLNTQDLDQ
ncbi:MAG: hypothetical protein ABJB12_07430 [Pseudomonadota bacterium]